MNEKVSFRLHTTTEFIIYSDHTSFLGALCKGKDERRQGEIL